MSGSIPPVVPSPAPPPAPAPSVWDWLSPSRLHGLGVAAAAIGAALSHIITGNTSIDGVIAVVAYVLVHLGIPDNTATAVALQRQNLAMSRDNAARLQGLHR